MSSITSKPTNPSREFPKRDSPLAAHMVAPGYFYDQRTGLVKPHAVAHEPIITTN